MREVTRADAESAEHERLSPRAAFADCSKGREHPSGPDVYRTCFQRDRDKIVHCKSFRRLSHKTQVFLSPEGDHFRSRLTHTLEVSQIACSIARALGLNADLAEAVALGHDLGHTPFGHTGEFALRSCVASHEGGAKPHGNLMQQAQSHFDYYDNEDAEDAENLARHFSHNRQSLRVVDVIENDGAGLNLSFEVRDGIVCHTGPTRASTLEGRVVAIADRIAYVNHDIDDAIRAGILSEADLPTQAQEVLGTTHAQRIETLVHSVVRASACTDDIVLDEMHMDAMLKLRAFLFKAVYRSEPVMREVQKAYYLVQNIFDYCMKHPEAVPAELHAVSGGSASRAVTDFVAGMTDRYALTMFEELFVPRSQPRRAVDGSVQ